MGKVGLAVLFVSVALGQDIDRVFRLKNAAAVISVQEIATTMRTVAQIQKLSVDNAAATLTIKGTPDQMALAEWLLPKLDVAEASNLGPQEYRVQGSSDDVVMVFELAHATTIQGIQEIITTLRTVANIQKIFTVTAPRIVTLRGDASQIALAKFLVLELDQEAQPRPSATVHEFKSDGGNLGTAMVYGLAHTDSPQSIQEIITNLRGVLSIQKVFSVTAPKLLAIRGSAIDVQMAEWLIPELDRQTANLTGNEARVPGGNDDVVHVFYLTHVTTPAGINGLFTDIRRTTHMTNAFLHSVPATLIFRGTADQIATAGRMIELSDRAAP